MSVGFRGRWGVWGVWGVWWVWVCVCVGLVGGCVGVRVLCWVSSIVCVGCVVCVVLKIFGGRLQDIPAPAPSPGPPLRWTAQNFALFFFSPAGNFILSSLPGGFTRQPENSKRAHFRAPAFKSTTKMPREDPPRERGKNEISGGREKKKREILGSPPSGPHHSGPPTTHHSHNEHPTSPPKKKMAKCGLAKFGHTILAKFGQIRLAKCGQLSLAKCGIGQIRFGQIRFGQMRSRPLDTVDRRKPNVTELIGPRLGTVSSKLYEIVTFHQKNFHQKPLSSKTTFIKNHFHPNHFHQNPFSPKTTFIKKPLSSKSNLKNLGPQTLNPKTPKHLNT